MREWFLRGYKDAIDGEPWRYAPLSETDWIEDPLRGDERDEEYWRGFSCGCDANFYAAKGYGK